MKVNWNSKYNTVAVYTVLTFSACLLVYAVLFNFTIVGRVAKTILSVAAPITWGLVIAYLVNPIMMWFERRLKKVTEKTKPRPRLNRVISLFISMLIFLAVLGALLAIILPQVFESVTTIFNNFGTYVDNCQAWANSVLKKYPELLSTAEKSLENFEVDVTGFLNKLVPKVSDIALKITDSAIGFIIAIKDFLIGLIVAVYFLFDKEHFQSQLSKFTHAVLPKKASSAFFRVCSRTNSSISGFITGKIIDSIIIGILCFICMNIMKLNFAVLISVIVGITNIIPFFGPFIGAIPSGLLLLVSYPRQVIPFAILILIIQQLDGNVIGPKILGQSTGISAFWVLFSILFGGGLFGFAGMILGVPVFAVVYSLFSEYINYLLEKKDMSTVTEDYIPKPPESVKTETASKSKKQK